MAAEPSAAGGLDAWPRMFRSCAPIALHLSCGRVELKMESIGPSAVERCCRPAERERDSFWNSGIMEPCPREDSSNYFVANPVFLIMSLATRSAPTRDR